MKVFLAVFLFLGVIGGSLKKSGLINTSVQEAQILYEQKNYPQAITKYNFLIDSLAVTDPELTLNLAHALYKNNSLNRSRKYYQKLTKNPDAAIQSVALNQLAILDFGKENPEKALYHLRRAIIQDPENEAARFNHELIKKYLAENHAGSPGKKLELSKEKKENQPKPTGSTPAKPSETGNEGTVNDNNTAGNNPQQNKPDAAGNTAGNKPNQNNKSDKISPGSDESGIKGPAGGNKQGLTDEDGALNQNNKKQKPGSEAAAQNARQVQTLRTRLRKTDLPPEKALQLLEAMRSAEQQYLQQLPQKNNKKNKATGQDY